MENISNCEKQYEIGLLNKKVMTVKIGPVKVKILETVDQRLSLMSTQEAPGDTPILHGNFDLPN